MQTRAVTTIEMFKSRAVTGNTSTKHPG